MSPIYELYIANRKSALLAAAVHLGLFEALHDAPLTLQQVMDGFELSERGADAMLVGLVSLDLLVDQGGRYGLSPIAEAELLPGRSGYLGGLIAQEVGHFLTPTSLLRALRTGRPEVGDGDVWADHATSPERAAQFTAAMDAISGVPARALAREVDLSDAEVLLDIGGGSGIFVRELLARHPRLQGVLLDLGTVCALAESSFVQADLSDRARVHPADMFEDPWPESDAILLSQILHDWSRDTCRELLAKAAASLRPRGRVIIHEKLLDDDRAGPSATAMVSLDMLQWTEGQQLTAAELRNMLGEAGFGEVQHVPTVGYWSVVIGTLA